MKKEKPLQTTDQGEQIPEDDLTRQEELEGEAVEKKEASHASEDGSGEVELTEPVAEEDLRQSLHDSREKAQEYLEGWQRSRAEFANYKKRIMREKKDIHKYARGEVIKLYLDIADDLGRALQDRPQEGEGAAWADGIELIYKKLLNKLEAEGVERMEAEGEQFDPNIHEAVFKEEHEEYESGQIIEVIQEGYFLGDKVLRPALVRVAA